MMTESVELLHRNISTLSLLVEVIFFVSRRSATAGPEDYSSDHSPAGDHWEGSVWGGVAGKVARRGCGGEDLLLQGREVVVS